MNMIQKERCGAPDCHTVALTFSSPPRCRIHVDSLADWYRNFEVGLHASGLSVPDKEWELQFARNEIRQLMYSDSVAGDLYTEWYQRVEPDRQRQFSVGDVAVFCFLAAASGIVGNVAYDALKSLFVRLTRKDPTTLEQSVPPAVYERFRSERHSHAVAVTDISEELTIDIRTHYRVLCNDLQDSTRRRHDVQQPAPSPLVGCETGHMRLSPDDILRLPWVQALRPLGLPYQARLSKHSGLITWHVDVELEEWPIPPDLQERWKTNVFNNDETWRKRPLVVGHDSGCKPFSCGEVELAARLRTAFPYSMWVSEWSTYKHIECWRRFCVKRTELEEREPELWAADNNLRAKSGALADQLKKRGGHPDVAAWRTQRDIVYVEYKGPGDSVNEKQDLWAQEVIRQNPNRFCYIAAYGRLAA